MSAQVTLNTSFISGKWRESSNSEGERCEVILQANEYEETRTPKLLTCDPALIIPDSRIITRIEKPCTQAVTNKHRAQFSRNSK